MPRIPTRTLRNSNLRSIRQPSFHFIGSVVKYEHSIKRGQQRVGGTKATNIPEAMNIQVISEFATLFKPSPPPLIFVIICCHSLLYIWCTTGFHSFFDMSIIFPQTCFPRTNPPRRHGLLQLTLFPSVVGVVTTKIGYDSPPIHYLPPDITSDAHR